MSGRASPNGRAATPGSSGSGRGSATPPRWSTSSSSTTFRRRSALRRRARGASGPRKSRPPRSSPSRPLRKSPSPKPSRSPSPRKGGELPAGAERDRDARDHDACERHVGERADEARPEEAPAQPRQGDELEPDHASGNDQRGVVVRDQERQR